MYPITKLVVIFMAKLREASSFPPSQNRSDGSLSISLPCFSIVDWSLLLGLVHIYPQSSLVVSSLVYSLLSRPTSSLDQSRICTDLKEEYGQYLHGEWPPISALRSDLYIARISAKQLAGMSIFRQCCNIADKLQEMGFLDCSHCRTSSRNYSPLP